MTDPVNATVVTAGDRAYAWGALLLVASMRRNGMAHPVVVGAMDWTEEQKRRICRLGDVTIYEIERTRQCLACQKPMLMGCDAVKTDWVCWADADGMFVGDCSEWLVGDDPDEIVIRRYDPSPPDFTPQTLEVWKQDVARCRGRCATESRYGTRVNTAFIVSHRKWRGFLSDWADQIEKVLPPDVEIIMKPGTPYFQTDESVLASLLCFDPEAPKIASCYRANGSADRNRYFAHFAYNPKPWQMWNSHSLKWHEVIMPVVDWIVEEGVVGAADLPLSLRRAWWPFYRRVAAAAPWVWRAIKLKRRLFRR